MRVITLLITIVCMVMTTVAVINRPKYILSSSVARDRFCDLWTRDLMGRCITILLSNKFNLPQPPETTFNNNLGNCVNEYKALVAECYGNWLRLLRNFAPLQIGYPGIKRIKL